MAKSFNTFRGIDFNPSFGLNRPNVLALALFTNHLNSFLSTGMNNMALPFYAIILSGHSNLSLHS
jgi:hypothetical protein